MGRYDGTTRSADVPDGLGDSAGMALLTRAKMLLEKPGSRIGLWFLVAAVGIRAFLARLPGWNPEALWADDLVYGAIVRSEDVWNMLTAPIQVAPGLFLVWRWCLAAFADPEWSLQLLPFVCGIAAIPVMALVVGRLTQDNSLALLAASLTALNPLLAHYTVFVRQYTIEFLVTALFLLAAAGFLRDGDGIDPRRFRRVALAGGVLPFFAMTSVFASFPVVNLGASFAVRDWFRNRRLAMIRLCGAPHNRIMATFAVDGNAPLCQCRAVRSLIPAAAAAAANVFPDIRFSRNRRTWASVINPSSTRKTGSLTRLSVGPRTGRSRPRQPAKIIVVDQFRNAIYFHLGGLDLYPDALAAHTNS